MCHSLALDLGTPPLPTSFRPSHPSSHCRPAHKRLIQPPRGLEEAISIRVSSCFFASVFHPDPNLSVLSLLCHLGIRVIRKKKEVESYKAFASFCFDLHHAWSLSLIKLLRRGCVHERRFGSCHCICCCACCLSTVNGTYIGVQMRRLEMVLYERCSHIVCS